MTEAEYTSSAHDSDGEIDSVSMSATANLLPIRLSLQWNGVSGPVEMEFNILMGEK